MGVHDLNQQSGKRRTMMTMTCLFALLVTLTPVLGADLLTVASDNGCRQVAQLIRAAGLDGALKSAHSVTLFAPSDAAVAEVPGQVLQQLKQNATLLAQVLKFHAVPRVARASDVTNDLLLPTLSEGGSQMRLNVYTSSVLTYVSVLPVIREVRNITVVTAEGAPVINTDLAADNGIVHVIDKVIYPLPTHNLPITLTFDKELSSLAYLIYEATLIDTLAGDAFTVFAPSNAALNKLPGQVYNDILMNLTRLQEVVKTHVVKGVLFSSGLQDGKQLTNVQGTQLTIYHRQDGLKVDGFTVSKADIPASNGAIHVIDTVIMPK